MREEPNNNKPFREGRLAFPPHRIAIGRPWPLPGARGRGLKRRGTRGSPRAVQYPSDTPLERGGVLCVEPCSPTRRSHCPTATIRRRCGPGAAVARRAAVPWPVATSARGSGSGSSTWASPSSASTFRPCTATGPERGSPRWRRFVRPSTTSVSCDRCCDNPPSPHTTITTRPRCSPRRDTGAATSDAPAATRPLPTHLPSKAPTTRTGSSPTSTSPISADASSSSRPLPLMSFCSDTSDM